MEWMRNLTFPIPNLALIPNLAVEIGEVKSYTLRNNAATKTADLDEPVLKSHLDGFEVSVHAHVHTGDRTVNYCPVLELDRHRLVRQLHQKPAIEHT
jgi:hypothetical protein